MLWDILSGKITIWYNSYIWPNSYFFCWNDSISIWKYCAIAWNFFAITYNHSTEYITSNINQYKNKINLNQEIKHWSIVIWNDVRIWWNVTVLPWVTIWNGAIVGAWAVVTKDIPPYAIVWGNPAKLIKYRFWEKEIEYIENTKWWDWPIDKIKRNERLFSKKVTDIMTWN